MGGAFVTQWAMILHGLIMEDGHIHLNLAALFEAEFAAGAVLISFGAFLGKVSPFKMVVVCIVEVLVYKLNAWLIFASPLVEKLGLDGYSLYDVGGGLIIHGFGAYFGLACAWVIHEDQHRKSLKEASSNTTDLFAMIGTIFLWMYWPSFNSIPELDPERRQIAIINTYLSLAAACSTTFAVSGFSDSRKRINMVHIQNATLAGGVMMGCAANMRLGAGGACLMGAILAASQQWATNTFNISSLKN